MHLGIKFAKSVNVILGRILTEGCLNLGFLTKAFDDFLIGSQTKGTDKYGNRNLLGTVYSDISHIIGVRFILQPCSTVRDNLGRIELLTGFISGNGIVDSRRTNKLADDYTLSTVDHKGSVLGHQRELAHEDFMLFDVVFVILIKEAHLYT